ncbi:transposase [Pedobacter duraquae]|uniref:transposase n=1 Tax=Pedobacter duraquae TaxID=425511 RepID=UPI0021D1A0B1|nr:transposase [Pedobacter duraquae]
MAANMQLTIKRCFVNARRVIDPFHVQKLANDAVQECRIKYHTEQTRRAFVF